MFKNKRFSRNYHKMIKRNKKEILKTAKKTNPWDWFWGIKLLVEHLKFMKEYYELHENVWAKEPYEWDSNAPKKSRLDMINEILKEYDSWMHCEEYYYHTDKDVVAFKEHKLEDGTYALEDLGLNIEYKFDNKTKTNELFKQEYAFHRNKFFELLSKYIEELWD